MAKREVTLPDGTVLINNSMTSKGGPVLKSESTKTTGKGGK